MKLFPGRKRVLLVNPETPTSYWGFQGSVRFVGARAAHTPLSLLTLAALLPRDWGVKLVDLNIQRLKDRDIAWADVVLLTGMIVQKDSLDLICRRCAAHDVPTVVGGPFASSSPDAPELQYATSVVVGEAECPGLMAALIEDIVEGQLQRRYWATEPKPEMQESPVPRFDLLKRRAYCCLDIQVSRGCPHRCEFCNVRMLFGKRPRYKDPEQVVAELQAIYDTGYRGNIFVVDDNFIGHPQRALEVLEAMADWQRRHRNPFLFYTEADVRLASLDSVVRQMVRAGFYGVFIGFESPSAEALREAAKTHNLRHSPIEAVRKLRRRGLLVYGGFIVGFDADDATIFERTKDFVGECKIDFAMAGMLTALPGTPLEQRLRKEGRLLFATDGDQFGLSNILPKRMSRLELVRGYRKLLQYLYAPKNYFARASAGLKEWHQGARRRVAAREFLAVPRSILRQGIFSRYRLQYWKFLLRALFSGPRKLPRAFAQAISGHHFFRYTSQVVIPRLLREERRLGAG